MAGYPVTVTRTYGTIHHEQDANPEQGGILLTRGQLNGWAALGRDLTDAELDRLADAIPNSSIPEAIGTIVSEALRLSSEMCDQCGRSLNDGEGYDGFCGTCFDAMTADDMRDNGIVPVGRASCPHGGLLLTEDPDIYDCTEGCGDD